MSKKQRKQSKAFVVSNGVRKYISGFLAGVLLVGGLLTPKYEAEAHVGYFLSILPDMENFSYLSMIVEEDEGNERNHAEFQFIDGQYFFIEKSDQLLPTTIEEYKNSAGSKFGIVNGALSSHDAKCFFTFPTCDTLGTGGLVDLIQGLFSDEGNGTPADREAASQVGNTLIKSINTALGYISRTAMTDKGAKWSYSDLDHNNKIPSFITITSEFANAARTAELSKTATFTVGGTTYTVKLLDEAGLKAAGITNPEPKKTNLYQYMSIKADNDSTSGTVFQYSIPRYPANPSLSTVSGISETLSIYNIIALGNTSYVNGGVMTTNLDKVYNPSFVEEIIYDILQFLLSQLRSIFGLHSMGDLMFNEGTYGTETFKGIAPVSWFQGADILFWTSQALAWLLLAFAALKFFGVHMWSTVTPLTRISLMNGIQNVLITAFCLTIIVPLFHMVTEFNYLIVDILRNTSIFNDSILTGNTFPPTLAGIILAFLFFFAELVINFLYILRGATIALLYGTSPLFIVAFAFGDRYQGITLKFIKELIGNIFIQTFHAIILTFYGLFIFTGTSGNFLVNLVMVFAFIPITKVFKDITGIGESGFIQGVAEQVKGHAVNAGKWAGGKVKDTAGGAFDAVAGDKIETFMKHSKDKYQPKASNEPEVSGEVSTSTYTQQQEGNLNSPENARSIGDSVGAGDSSGGSGSGSESPGSESSGSGGFSEDESVTLKDGGGNVNEFGNAKLFDKNERSPRKLDYLNAGGHVLGGALLGGLAGATGSKLLARTARNLSGDGMSAWSATRKAFNKLDDLKPNSDYEKGKTLMDSVGTDPDARGKASAQLHTYNGDDAAEQGIVNTRQATIDGKQCLVQEFSENAEIFKDLQDIKFDPSTGIVTDEKALAAGFTHISKTEDGNYRVSMDMDKIGVKDVRSYAGGSRIQIKTGVKEGMDNMNYAEKALKNMNNHQSKFNNPPQPNPNEQAS